MISVCAWVTTIARRALEVMVIGQARSLMQKLQQRYKQRRLRPMSSSGDAQQSVTSPCSQVHSTCLEQHSVHHEIRRSSSLAIFKRSLKTHFTPPPIAERRTVMSAAVCECVFVCLRAYLPNYTSNLHQIHATHGRGSVLLWRRSEPNTS